MIPQFRRRVLSPSAAVPNGLLVALVEYWSPIGGVWTGRHANNNGTLHAAPTIAVDAGVPGGLAVTLNGTSQYISVPDFAASHIPGSMTWAGRYRIDSGADLSVAGSRFTVSKQEVADAAYSIFHSVFFTESRTEISQGDNTLEVAPVQGVWKYWTLTFNRTTGATIFYIDAVAVDPETYNTVDQDYDTSPIVFGAGLGGSAGFFPGKISDFQVWSRVLSPTDIAVALVTDYAGYTA